MKRYITIALCALTVFGLGSCNKVHEEDFDNAGHSVTFQAQLGNDTRTGLALKFVPDWRETTLSDVHIWEVTGSERIEGEDIEMDIPGKDKGDYEIALFKADFSNMTIIVNPPSNAPATRAGETYVYTSIVAPKDASGKFTVPSTQTPNSATLIDPHADFIVGKSPADANFSQSQAGKQVNLIFTRPVAISRLSIMNVTDPIIRQVRIYSSDKLTGSASYENVNFENATVAFDNSGSNVITMDYGSGVAMPAEGIFNAYFVSLVGTKSITKIEVVTNAQTLTKEFEGGKALTFKVPDFKSIAVNMGDSVTPGPGEDQPQNIRFVKGGSAITSDTFDLYNGGTYVSPTVTGAAQGATLTYSSSDQAVATVSPAGVVTPVGEGETTISVNASKVEGYQAGYAEFTLTVTDSTPDPVDQPLKFMKGGVEVTSDTYDLYKGGTYVSPTLTGAVDGATVTYSITCMPEGCATISADGKVTPVAVGAVVVTATASAVAPLYNQTSTSYDLQIKDTTPVVGPTVTINLEAATELVAGEKYVLVSNGFALVRDGENAVAAAFDATAMTVAVPEDLQGNIEWTMGQNTDSNNRGNIYDFKNGDYFFGIAMNTTQNPYTYSVKLSTSKSNTGVANETFPNHNVNLETGYVYYRGNSSSQYIYYDGEAWNNYAASNGTFDPAYGTKLYKLKDMRAEQNPTFSAATAEYDLYEKKWTQAVPTLQNAQGTVTYESSNTAVATVNADGAVTIMTTAKSGDSAVITANAAGNDSYKPGSASYTINIVNTNPNVTTYVKVTSTADLEPGAKYLLVFEGLAGDTDGDGDPKVFDPVLSSDGSQFAKATSSALPVTIAGGVIESTDFDDCQFTLEAGYYLKGDKANKYIYPGTSGSSSVMLAENTASHALTITFTSAGIAEIMYRSNNQNRYLVWSTSNHYFSCNADVSGQYSTGICLYKMDDGRQAQTLTFNAAEFEYDLATSTWTPAEPALSGDQTSPLTWTSSNETVATVNASGAVTPKAKGTTTITVAAPASTTYKAATASFELTVVNSNETPSVFKRVTSTAELVPGGKYLLVYESGNFVFYPYLASGVFAKETDNKISVTISDHTITSLDLDACLMTLEEGYYLYVDAEQRYIYPASSSGTALNPETTKSHALTISIADGVASVSNGGQYFYYSTNSSWFSSTNNNGRVNTSLYKLDDGTTPEPPTPVAQNLSFNPTSVSGKVGESVTVPILSGYMTTVTYSSSDSSVAEVNASTGALTLKAEGTATITATAAAGTVGGVLYAEGTATYTVNVSAADPAEASTYRQISFATGITTGKYLIVNPADAYVFTTSTGTSNAAAVTVSGGVISGAYAEYEVTITKNGDNYTIQNGSNQYLYYNYNQGDQRVGYQANVNNWTINSVSGDANAFRFTSSNQNIYWNNTYFRIGGSGTDGVHLYKLDDGTTPEPPTPVAQTLSFNPTSVSGKVGESVTKPTLTGAMTTVTYSTSDATVAAVDVNNGNLTLNGEGTAIITATAAAGTVGGVLYAEGSATYTVNVSPADHAEASTYKQISFATGITTGKYLIVNPADAYVFTTSTGSTNAAPVTVAGGVISGAYAEYEVTITKNGDNYTIQNSSNQYLYYNYSQGDQRVGYQAAVNNWTINSVSGDANAFRFTSSSQNIYWNNTYFRIGGSGTNGVHLYKLDDGTTPEPPTPQPTSTYTQIAGDANLETGTYVIADKTNTYLLNASGTNNGGYSTINSTSGVTMSGSTITLASNVAEAHEFEITRTGDNLTVKKVGGDHEGQYLFASSGVANSYMGFQGTAATFVINKQTGTNLIYFSTTKSTSDPTEYLYKKAADQYFKLGQSGAPGGSDAGIYLYKKN